MIAGKVAYRNTDVLRTADKCLDVRTHMNGMTSEQVWAAREALEKGAATLLGQMLFEFARLDMALGLCLVWSDNGRQLKSLTKKVSAFSFHKKLDFLTHCVEHAYTQNSKEHTGYTEWITTAHTTRLLRNRLVHGRWGTDPYQQQVINVIGLPTSSEQCEARYSLQDLEKSVEAMKSLQVRLNEFREHWPL